MFDSNIKNATWTPQSREHWARRAYGRKVMLETSDGRLTATLDQDCAGGYIYLRGQVTGRMLVEGYCNGVLVFDEIISNEELDAFIELPRSKGLTPLSIEVNFIPATFGEVRIGREIEFVTHQCMAAPVKRINAPADHAPV